MPSTRNGRRLFSGVIDSAVATLLLAGPANAHHSFNMFDMQSMLTLEGRVTDFDYVNPHGYITVEVTDEQGETAVWQVETISALIMGRRGIDRDSLSVGEWVRIDARPPRNAERRFANGEVVHKLDGAELVVGFQQGQADLEAPPPAVAAVATGLAGIWRAESKLLDVAAPDALAEWPLTPAGSSALAAYDGSQNPWVDCVPYSPPVLMLAPVAFVVEVGDDVVSIGIDYPGARRTIHMDGRDHPQDEPPSNTGHSIGSWDGDELVIDTVNFAGRDLGHAFGIPSGPGKHLVERLSLSEDGTQIIYRYRVEDPEYLAEPVTGENRWTYRPDLQGEDLSCNPESARRFLDAF
jgi:hypothetical protein